MRKLIAVAMLVGGLLAVAGPATAQLNPGGVADPLTLAASGVLMPFFGAPGDVALLEVSSPVGDNLNAHMFFFDAHCNRVEQSHFLPVTKNGIAFLQVVGDGSGFGNPNGGVLDASGFFGGGSDPTATSGGLITIAASNDSFTLTPLAQPIHSRLFLFNGTNGRSKIVEPIILDAAEYPGDPHTWSPLRTAATFFSPQEGFVFPNGGVLRNSLWLICPKTTIVQAPYFSPTVDPVTGGGGFPVMLPAFPISFGGSLVNGSLRAVIFNNDERPLVDIHTSCDCVRTVDPITQISSIYSSAAALNGTYTKIETNPAPVTDTVGGGPPNEIFAFTGYKSTSSGAVNDFFGRLSNGSYLSIDGQFPPAAVTQGQR
jgi:hypothetical protein